MELRRPRNVPSRSRSARAFGRIRRAGGERASMRRLLDAWRIAAFDFAQAARTKKALVLLILYLVGALGATALFIKAVKAIEDALADTLMVAKTAKAGTMTTTLFQSEQFQRMVGGLVGDKSLAQSLFEVPPLALFYGALGLSFVSLRALPLRPSELRARQADEPSLSDAGGSSARRCGL
jgi:hypothetical protein